MKFGQAIDSGLFKNYFNLEGKATRSEYWWFMLLFIIFNLPLVLISILSMVPFCASEITCVTGISVEFTLPE